MTSSTVIAQLHLTGVERHRRESVERTDRKAPRSRRRRIRRRGRGTLGGSPPGAGGKLLQL